MPVFVAGDRALGGSPWDPRIRPFSSSDLVAVQVAGAANAIPRLGASGALVDLEYALRDADVVGDGSMEVWLAADAPDTLVAALADHGVRVVDDDAIADRLATPRQQGPSVAMRFGLLVALVGLLSGWACSPSPPSSNAVRGATSSPTCAARACDGEWSARSASAAI
ncbi:hypothetical protein ACFQX7_28980 [Luedemannella flava]